MTASAAEKTSVVAIRFQKLGKLYHFKIGRNQDLDPGDHVIVETKRGQQLGQVMAFIEPEKSHKQRGLRPVQRKATPRDLVMQTKNTEIAMNGDIGVIHDDLLLMLVFFVKDKPRRCAEGHSCTDNCF